MKLYPLRFFPEKTRFDFIGKRWWGFAFSLGMTLLACFFLLTKGLNYGIDFTGGALLEIRTEKPADLAAMRSALDGGGFGEVSLQSAGSDRDVLVRIQAKGEADQAAVVAHAKEILASAAQGQIEYRKVDYVGPAVGKELIQGSMIAVACALAAIMAYLWFRFEWQFGVGGVLALLHDAIMVVGFFAVTQFEFGLTAIAAVLTILGYSINDSVVIYDRVRETMRRYKKMPMPELLNLSINETLSRTVMTAMTVLLSALALALYGGEVIRGFSWSLVFGAVVGTYSSVYISGAVLIYLNLRANTGAAQAQGETPAGARS